MPASQRERDFAAAPLPFLRFEIAEAARILRMSRAQLYIRIGEGSIRPQKDGARTYIARAELERYVESCDSSNSAAASKLDRHHQPIADSDPAPRAARL